MKNINSHNEPNINVPGDIRDEVKLNNEVIKFIDRIVIEDFIHNNMVPFFGDLARQMYTNMQINLF